MVEMVVNLKKRGAIVQQGTRISMQKGTRAYYTLLVR